MHRLGCRDFWQPLYKLPKRISWPKGALRLTVLRTAGEWSLLVTAISTAPAIATPPARKPSVKLQLAGHTAANPIFDTTPNPNCPTFVLAGCIQTACVGAIGKEANGASLAATS